MIGLVSLTHALVALSTWPTIDLTHHDGTPSIIMIGDTGEPGPIVERWRATLQKKDKDAIFVLGDLVYPQAPPCPTGTPDAAARAMLEQRVGDLIGHLGAPTLLVIGNHDTSWVGDPPREKCVIAYARGRPDLTLPGPYYAVDFGLAVVVVLNSNALDDGQAAFAKRVFAAARPGARKILAAHHVLKVYHDKVDEDDIRPWLAQHALVPDLWVNGHAHLLQLGIYGGIPALTSGTAAKPRARPACDRTTKEGQVGCGEGELFGSSLPGYAVLDLDAHGRFTITFEDADGQRLYRWQEPAR